MPINIPQKKKTTKIVKRTSPLFIGFIAFLVCMVAFAGVTSTVVAHNSVRMDTVDIELVQHNSYTPENNLISKDETKVWSLSIDNKGAQCWIRARIVADSSQGKTNLESEQSSEANWTESSDGWYYMTTPLDDPGSTPFDVIVTAPESWLENGVSKMNVTVEAQALQYKNLEDLNFADSDPWRGIEPEDTIHTRLEYQE